MIDERGFDALTVSNVAEGLAVGPSALYSHLDGLEALRYHVAVAATENLTDVVRTAAIGAAGPQALAGMGEAYRRFALAHPGQFASTLLPPRAGDDDLVRATEALLEVFVLVYRGMGLDPDQARLAARTTRSAIHGFLALEHVSGSGPSHDDEYRHLLGALQRGLAA